MSDDAPPPASAALRADSGLLLVADISGYTAFLATVASAHPDMMSQGVVPPAYPIMVTLLDTVADRLSAVFRLVHMEGDAVLAYAPADQVTGAWERVREAIATTYAAFHERLRQARILQGHDCQACVVITTLELKYVLHAGAFVIQQQRDRTEIAGPAVNAVHRLLKNRITETTGLRAYAFTTDAALELLGARPEGATAHEEGYPDVGTISGMVLPMRAPSPA